MDQKVVSWLHLTAMQCLFWVATCPAKVAITTEQGENEHPWHREPLPGAVGGGGGSLGSLNGLDGTGENND